ncbi:MAG: hypothetical protein K1X49_03615 [Saprospiraceae bacterium]|jgi:hypothetical protein|nr:hypothetical protein [Saprospiraceae bacterium]
MKSIVNYILDHISGKEGSFDYVFFKNEFYALNGVNLKKLSSLLLIVLASFLSISFAINSLNNLERRMNNPFTNWVDMTVSRSIQDSVPRIKEYFGNAIQQKKFNIQDIKGYVRTHQRFYRKNSYEQNIGIGRSIEASSQLEHAILSSSNVLYVQEEVHSEMCAIIITESFLRKLGFEPGVKKLCIKLSSGPILVSVKAVVRQIPNLCDFVLTNRMYNLLVSESGKTGFVNFSFGTNVIHFFSNENSLDLILNTWKSQYPDVTIGQIEKIEEININHHEILYKYDIVFPMDNIPEEEKLNLFFQKVEDDNKIFMLPFFEINCDFEMDQIENPYYLAFNFNSLDKIRHFREESNLLFGAEISMNQVEDKENFAMVSAMTYSIIIFLMIFSIYLIINYLTSVFSLHLEKLKPNLGTIMAFGLSSQRIIQLYSKIVMLTVSLCIIFSIVSVFLLELITSQLNSSFGFKLNVLIFAYGLLVSLISLYFMRKYLKFILIHSPGDLVYKRI